MTSINISGFIAEPKKNAKDRIYRGRFTCPDVQWIESSHRSFCTFTVTAGEIADAAASGLLWTDQDVQRGIQPSASPRPPRELSLSSGYPDSNLYIFDGDNADDIVRKLLEGETLFLNPLIWNMRPKAFEAYFNVDDGDVYIYSGKIYLPDSHHRHQAINKAVKLWREAPSDYPNFSDDTQFKIELYFLTREDEGNYFFDKNQRPKPTAKSKAYDLTTQDDLSILAKKVIEKSGHLKENVNRVTDRLDAKNPQVVTLSTVREMMRIFSSDSAPDASELEGLASVAAEFYDMLAEIRPELSRREIHSRKDIRSRLVVDAAVMMHGYAYLMKSFNSDLARLGTAQARINWRHKLKYLGAENQYTIEDWAGDLFDKRNPIWAKVGVTRPDAVSAKITVLNTGSARSQAGRVLQQLLAASTPSFDLAPLSRR
jgi:hypothetical protein